MKDYSYKNLSDNGTGLLFHTQANITQKKWAHNQDLIHGNKSSYVSM